MQRLLHSRTLIFNGNQHQYNTRYDLTADGQVKWAAGTGGHSHGWYSLSGAMFSMKGMKPLALQYGWRAYDANNGTSWAPPTYTVAKGMCVIQGLTRAGSNNSWGNTIAVTPKECRPKKRLMFHLNGNQWGMRVDLEPNGRFAYHAGRTANRTNTDWQSLTGMVFALTGHENLPMHNGWRGQGGEWGTPTFAVNNGICIVSGLCHSALNQWGHMATLPGHCRPSRRLIFTLNNNFGQARVDVFQNGQVHFITGNRDHKWLSFSGIQFAAKN